MISRLLLVFSVCVMLALAVAAQSSTLSDLSRDLAAIAKQASPAAVQIDAVHNLTRADDFGLPAKIAPSTLRRSVGSGFVVDPGGYILTSYDVAAGGKSFTVRFNDGTSAPGTLAGSDPVTNCALIKVDKTGLKALKLGDSDALQPGMLVVTVNSQAGMSNSVALGVVSATDREAASSAGPVLQISGTIGPGSSGGAVLDTEGRVVGITFAMFSPTSVVAPFNLPKIFVTPSSKKDGVGSAPAYEGMLEALKDSRFPLGLDGVDYSNYMAQAMDAAGELASMIDVSRTSGSSGFAIPINRIKPILEELKSGKTIEHAALGMRLDQTPDGIAVKPSKNSPADRAGVKEGDILASVNGRQFATVPSITAYITSLRPGDKVNLVVRRGGKEVPISVIAASRKDIIEQTTPQAFLSRPKQPSQNKTFSLSLENAGVAEVAKALSTASGTSVVVVNPESIKGKVTVHLNATTLEQALPMICEPLGCKYAKSGTGYTIRPAK